MGFNRPSKIQETALPMLLNNNHPQNLIAQSQSGTGKTAAFVLTMLSRIDQGFEKNKNFGGNFLIFGDISGIKIWKYGQK